MNYAFLGLRLSLIVLCIETAVRYAVWWLKVGPWPRSMSPQKFLSITIRGDDGGGILPPLMLGIAAAQAGIAIRHFDAFYYQPLITNQWIWVMGADVFMLIGTLLHLIPAWEIDRRRSLSAALFIRVCIIATLAVIIVLLDYYHLSFSGLF